MTETEQIAFWREAYVAMAKVTDYQATRIAELEALLVQNGTEMTMSDERELLWDDIRISAEAGEATDELDGTVYVRHVISQLLVKMRGDYEAQLSNQYQRIERFVELVNQLEAQLAQTWQPLPISQVVQYNGEWPAMPAEYANDELAICRLVTQEPTL